MLRRAFLSVLLLSVAVAGRAESSSGVPGVRGLWLDKMEMVCGKVLKAQAEGTLRKDLPMDSRRIGEAGEQLPNPQSAPFEAFARALVGIAAWLELPPSDDAEGRLRAQYLDWARRGLANAVNPDSPGYLELYHEPQSLVECAYLVQALWLAPTQLWGAMPEKTQRAICEEFLRHTWQPKQSNWLFFGALPHLFGLEHGTEGQRRRVLPYRVSIAPSFFMDMFYKGDGWYGDGMEFHLDYYNSYVIHPMLHDMLQHLQALPKDRRGFLGISDEQLARWKTAEPPRFRRHAQFLERMIMTDGTYPQQGRSGQYRFGCFQVLSYACLLAERGEPLSPCDPGQARAALTAVLERQCTAANFDPQGWLYIGFNGNQPWAAEMYCTPGSVYLCATIFHVLGLPPSALFWTAPSKDWTSRQAWFGGKYERDRSHRELE